MSTWQEFRDTLSANSALFSARMDLVAQYQAVYQAAQAEDRSSLESDMYVLFSTASRKVQPAAVDSAVNKLMADFRTIDAVEGDQRPDKYTYSPKL